MSRQEKTAWFSLVVLSLAILLYLSLFQIEGVIPNVRTSVILFLSANVLMILCNFGNIIFYDKQFNTEEKSDENESGIRQKKQLYHHLFYWAGCISVLTGTWLWMTLEVSGSLSGGF